MQYKILEIDKRRRAWIKIEVTFDDGEKYTKRMMADTTSAETIDSAIKNWLVDYLPLRKDEEKVNFKSLTNKPVTFTQKDLPTKQTDGK